MVDKKYIIYKTTNTVNNKIYIGKHETDDISDNYLGSGIILKKAIEKYGIDKFNKEILFECNSKEEMNELEAEIVDEQFVARLDTYNLKLGGQGGFDHLNNGSEEHKKRCQKANIKALESGVIESVKKRMKELYGDTEWCLEHSLKVSNGLKLYYETHDSPFLNKKHNEKSKKMIGDANSKHQSGKGNSQYGTCWIYNDLLKENKKIKKEQLTDWLNDGWVKGRKQIIVQNNNK